MRFEGTASTFYYLFDTRLALHVFFFFPSVCIGKGRNKNKNWSDCWNRILFLVWWLRICYPSFQCSQKFFCTLIVFFYAFQNFQLKPIPPFFLAWQGVSVPVWLETTWFSGCSPFRLPLRLLLPSGKLPMKNSLCHLKRTIRNSVAVV